MSALKALNASHAIQAIILILNINVSCVKKGVKSVLVLKFAHNMKMELSVTIMKSLSAK